MAHTAIPYASFSSAADRANSEGGLWYTADGNNSPGSFFDYVSTALLNTADHSGFTGQIYGDVDVSTVGGPSSFLYFVWTFLACAALPDGTYLTTTVGKSQFFDTLPGCISDPSLSEVTHNGTVQVNSDGTISLTLYSAYDGEGTDNVNVYIAGFKLQLALVPGSSSGFTGSTSSNGEPVTTSIAGSNGQYHSQSSVTAAVSPSNVSTLPSTTGSRLSSITASRTKPQSDPGTASSPSSLTPSVITSLPRYDTASPNHFPVAPIVGGAAAGLALLFLITFLIWKYRCVWRRWKTWERQKSRDHLEPFFVNSGQENRNMGIGGCEERNGNVVAGNSCGWGRNGFRTMDGYGLEIVEKIRLGMPVAYPLPESLEIERGEKARALRVMDDSQTRGDETFDDGNRVSETGTSHSATPIVAVSNTVIEAFNDAIDIPPSVYSSRRFAAHDQDLILMPNSQTRLRIQLQPFETISTQNSPPSIAPPPSLMRRMDLLSGLLHQILTSGVPTGHTDVIPTNPPPAYESEEMNRV